MWDGLGISKKASVGQMKSLFAPPFGKVSARPLSKPTLGAVLKIISPGAFDTKSDQTCPHLAWLAVSEDPLVL